MLEQKRNEDFNEMLDRQEKEKQNKIMEILDTGVIHTNNIHQE